MGVVFEGESGFLLAEQSEAHEVSHELLENLEAGNEAREEGIDCFDNFYQSDGHFVSIMNCRTTSPQSCV